MTITKELNGNTLTIFVEGWLDTVAYSTGLYGRSGTLYRGHNTGKMYVITSRTSAIYLFP